MTSYVVNSGVISSGLTLLTGDTETVLSGGSAVDTTVSSGGSLILGSGELAFGSQVSEGGTEIIAGFDLEGVTDPDG